MGRGGYKLGRQGVGLGEDVFVSLLQVFKKGVDGVIKQVGQPVCICREEDGEQHSVIFRLQRPMGAGDMPDYSE
jgi:hypothetical protein